MNKLMFLAVALAMIVGASAQITNSGFPNFPHTIDGTVVWVTTMQRLRGSTASINGAHYMDYVCANTGPLPNNWNEFDNTRYYSRAIICTNNVAPDSLGNRGIRTAGQYFNYGRGATVNSHSRPVYAFDVNSRPTRFVQIASNPSSLISQGISKALAPTFTIFYGPTAQVGTNSPSTAEQATFPAWTGCTVDGNPQNLLTCNDWTSASASVEGVVGNTGSGNGGFPINTATVGQQFDRSWLDLRGNSGTQRCDTPNLWVFCSWIPTADDGWQNGDETSVDCGGNTLKVDGSPQNFCGPCPPGTSGPNNGPCVDCRAGTYSKFGGSAPCSPCSSLATSAQRATFCFCTAGNAAPAGYEVNDPSGSTCFPLIRGDPQITGLQGQDFQVHGIPDEYFNMVSTPEFQANSRFVFLNEARCMDNSTTCFTHPGTYIDVMAFTVGGHKIKVVAGTYEQGLTAYVAGSEIKVGAKITLTNPAVTIEFLSTKKIAVTTALFRFVLINSDNFMNQEVSLLDEKLIKLGAPLVKIAEGESRPHADIPIHGIVGQTWLNAAYPSNMFIEGQVADYRVADGAFGTDFVFNVFGQ